MWCDIAFASPLYITSLELLQYLDLNIRTQHLSKWIIFDLNDIEAITPHYTSLLYIAYLESNLYTIGRMV